MTDVARASHCLARRSVQLSARPSLRQLSISRGSVASPTSASAASETVSAELSTTSNGNFNPRKSRLVTKLTERDEAERRDREREQRKSLLKDKRNTAQALTQARHAANDAASKAKRGNVEIAKVQDEIDKLQKWKQNQEERLKQLMQQLIEEQRLIEEEFEQKFSDADDIRNTLVLEQEYLESEAEAKEAEIHGVEYHLKEVEEALEQLDSGKGLIWNGGWKDDEGRGSYDDSSPTLGASYASERRSISAGAYGVDFSGSAGLKKAQLEDAQRAGDAKVPASVLGTRSSRSHTPQTELKARPTSSNRTSPRPQSAPQSAPEFKSANRASGGYSSSAKKAVPTTPKKTSAPAAASSARGATNFNWDM